MLRITVVCVGKVRENFLTEGIREYEKRLSAYCRLQWAEVPDERIPDAASEREEEAVRSAEGERIRKKIPGNAYVIALAIDGKMRDSVGFSEHLDGLASAGRSHLVFLIGGSLGLSREILALADEKMSFSRMTFPHQLMRLIFLEQLYRAFRISHNEPYHK